LILEYKKNLKIYSLTTRRKYIIRAINDIDSYNHPDETDDELLKNIVRLPHYPINQGWNLWYRNVKRKGYEGMVLKNSKAKWDDIGAWARIKNTTEIDYMCIGFEPADPESRYTGQVGAVRGSLIDYPCDVKCGGLTDAQRIEFTDNPEKFIGKVFTATGHGWFPSGSIRHPKYSHFRDDKSTMALRYLVVCAFHHTLIISKMRIFRMSYRTGWKPTMSGSSKYFTYKLLRVISKFYTLCISKTTTFNITRIVYETTSHGTNLTGIA
jgi:hypothetical protein